MKRFLTALMIIEAMIAATVSIIAAMPDRPRIDSFHVWAISPDGRATLTDATRIQSP